VTRMLDFPHTREERAALLQEIKYRWSMHRRPEQHVSDDVDWTYWFYCAGRGSGKTRAGAEKVREWAEKGVYKYIALIAPTYDDVETVMLEGPSGIYNVCPPNNMPMYNKSSHILQWPDRKVYNEDGDVIAVRPGMKAKCYSAEKPEKFRGPNFEAAWADELAAWRFPHAWELLQFCVRVGPAPRVIITSTPRATKLVKEVLTYEGLVVTTGTTYDNVKNLSPIFYKRVITKFENTRLGRQEINAEILDDNPNALWEMDWIDANRINVPEHRLPEFERIVVGVDPAVTAKETSDETGIVVCARDYSDPPVYYTLEDATMTAATPEEWGAKVVEVFNKWKADEVVGEGNNGGDMVRAIIHNEDPDVPVEIVFATRGKTKRAEPVAQLAQQKRDRHWGMFSLLEAQQIDWNPQLKEEEQDSPDRMDAKVWATTRLMEIEGPMTIGRVA